MSTAKADTGMFRDERADDLSAHCMRSIVERTGIEPGLINEIRWGCVQQQGEQGYNVARMAAMIADMPVEVPAVTVNRLCASSMEAIAESAKNIMLGYSDVEIAGGVEHMGHIAMDKDYDASPKLHRKWSPAVMMMGLTAEYLAIKYQIPRALQDEFALRSQELALQATEKGEFADEIVPTWGRDDNGSKVRCTRDQGIRPTTIEALAELRPAFGAVGTVTAGNSSQLSAGAAAVLIMSEDKARELGMKPLARILSSAAAGVDPGEMGIGPCPASMKALKRAGLKMSEIDIFEFNEAFAAQALSCLKVLQLDIEKQKINLHGGAVALGHPLGCSGARIVVTLTHLLKQKGGRYGLATLCIGGGMGMATVLESCN